MSASERERKIRMIRNYLTHRSDVTDQLAGTLAASGSAFFEQYNIPKPEVERISLKQAERIQTERLPDLIAEGTFEGIKRYEEDREKRENSCSQRLRRCTTRIIEWIIVAAISVFVTWYLASQGFRA